MGNGRDNVEGVFLIFLVFVSRKGAKPPGNKPIISPPWRLGVSKKFLSIYKACLGPYFIIVSNILNALRANKACGTVAGMMMLSPILTTFISPPITSSASPSMT